MVPIIELLNLDSYLAMQIPENINNYLHELINILKNITLLPNEDLHIQNEQVKKGINLCLLFIVWLMQKTLGKNSILKSYHSILVQSI